MAACALLRSVRLLTLTGTGGIGKTRLAIQIARAMAEDYPGAVAWVTLADLREPAEIPVALAGALSVVTVGQRPVLASLKLALRAARLLLVLDNFEHLITGATLVAELLVACPGLKVLVTSRAPLRISGEHLMAVPPLALPTEDSAATERSEAVRLFTARAQAVVPSLSFDGSSVPLVVEICRRLDGLPLAIELAAARVNHLALPTMLQRLDQRLSLLTGGPGDSPIRQRTLRNTIGWSFELLSPLERAVFARLAVVAGGFTLEAAEAIVGSDGEVATPILDAVTSLVDKSLVRHEPDAAGGPRYVLLETIREYAAEQLAHRDDRDATRNRHAAYYQGLVREAQPILRTSAAGPWLVRLDAEHDNCRAALHWLATSGQWRPCLRLAVSLAHFWDQRGNFREGRDWLGRALNHAQAAGASADLLADARSALGMFTLRMGEFDLAETHITAAWEAYRCLGDPLGEGTTILRLGGIAEYRGDDAVAWTHYERALTLFRECGDPSGVAEALDNLADTAYRMGDYARAQDLAERGTALGDAPDPVVRLDILISLGAAIAAQGDWARASATLVEALNRSQDMGYPLAFADALSGLADVAAAAGEPVRAARVLGAVDGFAQRLGIPRLPHLALYRRAAAAARAALGAEAFDVAHAAGRALSLDQVSEEAKTGTPATGATKTSAFSPRERDVTQLLVKGYTDRAIADELFISTRTVESHVARIFAKLGVHTRAGAVSAALATGLVEPALPDFGKA